VAFLDEGYAEEETRVLKPSHRYGSAGTRVDDDQEQGGWYIKTAWRKALRVERNRGEVP
jgi:hypothetical protein